MNPIRRNIIANLVGNGANAIATLICTPIYAHMLGIEAYGLVGVYMTLQTLTIFFDMGLSTTINREIARLSAEPHKAQQMKNLVRTLETIYWLFGAAICFVIILLTPMIVDKWLHFQHLRPPEAKQAIRLAALAIGLRWPLTLYSGGLMGLQRQVSLNWILSTTAILQSFGAIAVLSLVAPSMHVFFLWQVVMAAVPTVWSRQCLQLQMPTTNMAARFILSELKTIWRFTAGAGAFTVTSMLLNQIDKIVLTKMVSLEAFGYYNIASVAAGAIYRLVGPVFSAIFPLFSSLIPANDIRRLTQSYHKGCELVSVLICPPTALGVIFSGPILLLWTRSNATSLSTHTTMSFLLAASALNALVYVPYALQLAYGWTTLGVYMNLFGLMISAVLLPLMISSYGALGAAAAKLVISLLSFAIGPLVMHRRILIGEARRWYLGDVGRPLAAASAVTSLGTLLNMKDFSPALMMASLAAISILSLSTSILAVKQARAYVRLLLEGGIGRLSRRKGLEATPESLL